MKAGETQAWETLARLDPEEVCARTGARLDAGDKVYRLSLFGHDIPAGQTATARARLVVTDKISDEEIMGLYEVYKRDF